MDSNHKYINSDRVLINPLNFPDEIIFNFYRRFDISLITGCWVWIGLRNNQGYGQLGRSPYVRNGKNTKAHQLSWMIYNGEIPDGLYVCHKCDNPSCVNPEHLWLGTPMDNTTDKMEKGRYKNGSEKTRGEKNISAKLKTHQVLHIKNSNEKSSVLAKKYRVGQGTINDIRRGETWAWLK